MSLALAMEAVEEVIPARNLHALPGAHPWVAGILVRRGRAIGVVDMQALGGGESGGGDETLILTGDPGLALLGGDADAVTRDHGVAPVAGPDPIPAVVGLLRCPRGRFSLLDATRLRRHLGAERRAQATDDTDDTQDTGHTGDPVHGGRT